MKISPPKWFQQFIMNLAKAYHPRYTEASNILPGWPVYSEQDLPANIKAIKHVLWAYICIAKINRTVAGLPMKFYQGYGDKKNEIFSGDIVDLIYRPNSEDTHRELWMDTVGFLYGTGSSYWAIDGISQFSRRPVPGKTMIWTLPAHKVEIIPAKGDPTKRIAAYDVLAANGQKIRYESDEVIQFKMFNLESQYHGLAPLTVAMRLMETDYYARNHNRLFFKHGASPGLHLKTDQKYDEPTEKRILESFRQGYGGNENAHKIMISWSGLEPIEQKKAPKDLDFINLIKLNREEIIALFGIPPAEVGLFEYANYANAEAQKKQYWMETIVPILQLLETRLNEHVFPLWTDKEIWFEFDLSGVEALKENLLDKAKISVMLHNSGIFTANEIREEYWNADVIEGGDELKKPQPFGAPAAASLKAKAFDNRSDLWFQKDINRRRHERKFLDEMKSYFAGERSRILKRLAGFPNDYQIDASNADGLVNEIEEQGILEDQTKPIFEKALSDSGQSAIEEVTPKKSFKQDESGALGGDFDITDPQVVQWIEAKVARFVTLVGDSTKQKIRDICDQAYQEGWTINQLADEIGDINNTMFNAARSLRIAQTEMGAAANAGSMMGYRQSGVVEKKVWLTARDGLVRDSHYAAEADGAIGLQEKFSNGLDHPHDMSGPAEEVVNCRCSIAAEVEGGE